MKFEEFREEVKTEIIDSSLLRSYLSKFKKPRDKMASLVKEGKLIRLKKGLYLFGKYWSKAPPPLEVIANTLYGPSCVSFEYALFQYGLIPERPVVITSLTLSRSKTFTTPTGIFEYKAIGKEKFKIGIEYNAFFIASKEKALVDLIYRTPGIRTLSQLRFFLFEEMRIDNSLFKNLDLSLLKALVASYKKSSLNFLELL